jgi:hypothetical protein
MNNLLRYLVFFAALTHSTFTSSYSEFLYPVGTVIFENSERIVILYQQGAHLELWLWDPVTKTAFKGLSHYTPAGLTVLPSGTQFSFIDHERIRIKALFKKSPKALDMYPLYDFGLVYWIDDQNCYCSARERHHYNLFHITTEGDLYRLTRSNAYDYTYPQKIGSDLFYIKRNEESTYTIEKVIYPTDQISTCQAKMHDLQGGFTLEKIELASEDTPRSCLSEAIPELLFSCTEPDKALTFLHMKNAEEGFFLKHIDHPFIERFEKIMTFECWHLIKQEKKWSSQKLFSFSIPLHFLYGENRLYESILRLLPLYTRENIFYVSANNEGYLHVYRYSTLNASSTCLAQAPHSQTSEEYLFTPYFYKGIGLCGGMVKNKENSLTTGPTIEEAEQGEQIFEFPVVNAIEQVTYVAE